MKNTRTLTVVTALGLSVCSSAFAQGRPNGGQGQLPGDAQQQPKDAAFAVTHIAEAYPKIAPFDVNKDGLFDADERRALGQAMRDGKVERPASRNPEGNDLAHPGVIIQRIVGLYRAAFSFDADKDGLLSAGELAALKSAIEKGEVKRPGDAQQQPKDATSAVTHIAEVYPKIAAFDTNKDGIFDGDERRALGQAMSDGKVEGPANRNPEGDEPPHLGVIIQRIASLYGVAFAFDANKDGSLSESELAALKSAIEKGEVKRPGVPNGGSPS